jgi:hypothetical protein
MPLTKQMPSICSVGRLSLGVKKPFTPGSIGHINLFPLNIKVPPPLKEYYFNFLETHCLSPRFGWLKRLVSLLWKRVMYLSLSVAQKLLCYTLSSFYGEKRSNFYKIIVYARSYISMLRFVCIWMLYLQHWMKLEICNQVKNSCYDDMSSKSYLYHYMLCIFRFSPEKVCRISWNSKCSMIML